MISFGEMHVENFLSFRRQTVNLDQSTTVMVEGRVDDEHGHDSNGAGKSSIWDALYWCLTGTTLRHVNGKPLRHDDVINRDAKQNCVVKLTLEIDGVQYVIVRARKYRKYGGNRLSLYRDSVKKSNEISGASNTATQDLLYELLGMSEKSLRYSVFFDDTRYSELSPTDRMTVLEKILDLDSLEVVRARAAKRVRDLDDTKVSLERQISQTSATVTAKLEQVNDLKDEAQRFEQSREEELSSIASELSTLKTRRAEAKKRLDSAQDATAEISGIQKKLRSLQSKRSDAQTRLQAAKLDVAKAQKSLSQIEGERRVELRTLKQLRETDICPRCNQPIDNAELIARSEAHLEALVEVEESRLKKLEKAQELLTPIQDELTKIRESVDELREKAVEARTIEKDKEVRRQQLDSIMRNGRRLVQRRTKLRKAKNTARVKLKKARKALTTAKATLEQLKKDLTSVQDDVAYYQFWVKAFAAKGSQPTLKSFIIRSIIPELNAAVRHFTTMLTDGELDIRFSAEKTLKSGKTSDEFSILVSKKQGGESYGNFSKGERRRADLCISAALQKLISSRAVRQTTLSVFDEAFTGLDSSGIERVAEMLSRLPAPTFVISHRSDLKDLFPVTWTVQKKNGVSTIKEN